MYLGAGSSSNCRTYHCRVPINVFELKIAATREWFTGNNNIVHFNTCSNALFMCTKNENTAKHTHSLQWRKKQSKWKEREKKIENGLSIETVCHACILIIRILKHTQHTLIRIIKFIIFHVWLLLFTVSYSFYFLSINSNILNHNNFDRKSYDWNYTHSVCNMHIYVYGRTHHYTNDIHRNVLELLFIFFSAFHDGKNATELKWILDIYQSLDSTAI